MSHHSLFNPSTFVNMIRNWWWCDTVLANPQMDYRSLVHEKDQAIYSEIRVILFDIRGFYVSWNDSNLTVSFSWSLTNKKNLFFFCRQRCTISSTRIWIKWPIQKERRSPPCTDDRETHSTINNFLASELVSFSHIKTDKQQLLADE